MRPSPKCGAPFARLLLRVVAGAIAAAFSSFAVAKQAPVLLTEPHERPANLYRSVFQKDEAACRPILTSLNMKYELSPEELADNYNDLNGDTDLLLASDLHVPWERKLLWDENLNIPRDTLDFASVSLTNDGQKRGLYRWGFSSLHYNSINELFLSDTPPTGFQTAAHLTPNAVKELSTNEIEINSANAPDLPWRKLAGGFFLFNVVVVDGRTFVIAADAGQVTQSYLRGGNRGLTKGSLVELYVLQFESLARVKPICQFRVR
jgi:hypothetical protein